MILALSEGLELADTARLLLACAAHDLGRLKLTQDIPELRHGEVSGVLAQEHLRDALMPLGPSVFLPVRQAVLMHTRAPTDEQLYFRVLDDVRICDGLDCNGTGAGFVRSAFNASAGTNLKADLPDKPLKDLSQATSWLDDWRFRSENQEAPLVRLSAWGWAEREFRHGAARELIAAWEDVAGDPAGLVDDFCKLAGVVEPDASLADMDRAARQLVALSDEEQARWTGILAWVRADYIAEARRLRSILTVMVQGRNQILAPLAAWLLTQGVARLP
jgi:hypothetical protein